MGGGGERGGIRVQVVRLGFSWRMGMDVLIGMKGVWVLGWVVKALLVRVVGYCFYGNEAHFTFL